MRVGNERRKERKQEWMKERMYEWMNEIKEQIKKKYETKYKTFLNKRMIICFLTAGRTLENSRDASPASEILHSKCERDEVVVLQESSFLWRPLVWNNLTPRPFDKTEARAHAHPHTHKWYPLFLSETHKLCNYISRPEFPFMLPERATEFNIAVKYSDNSALLLLLLLWQ